MNMKKMTLEHITMAVCGEYIGDEGLLESSPSDITFDSRTVNEGSLFVAIKGQKSDGHDFINSSLSKGAVCCLSERAVNNPTGPYILVKSTLQAIKDLAEYYRGLFTDTKFIGITGSVGKTTTKEMVSAVLSEKFTVHKTSGNHNNEIGVPMTIFGLREGHEVAVIEMGISEFGEMHHLTRMVQPDIVIMSTIGYSHLEFLGSREGVLKAKGEIFRCAAGNGTAIVNGDDDLLEKMQPSDFASQAANMEKICYGLKDYNHVRARNVVNCGIDGMQCDINLSGRSFQHVKIPAFGNHMIYAALAAAAIGDKLGLSGEEIARGIANFKNAGKRADIVDTGYITIIDDCYNANPTSVKAALDSLTGLDGRCVAILGDMGELGEGSDELHEMVGDYAAGCGIDCLIAVGVKAEKIYRGAKNTENNMEAWHFPNKEELFSVLYTLIRQGDSVLVKASRSNKFEDIVSELKKFG